MRSLADFSVLLNFPLWEGEINIWKEGQVTATADLGKVLDIGGMKLQGKQFLSCLFIGLSLEPLRRDFFDMQSFSGPAFSVQPVSPVPAVASNTINLI